MGYKALPENTAKPSLSVLSWGPGAGPRQPSEQLPRKSLFGEGLTANQTIPCTLEGNKTFSLALCKQKVTARRMKP